jgi:ELWxxDGT repeat protein
METNTGQVVLVKDIIPGGEGSFPFELTELNNKLYFYAEKSSNEVSFWVSDGTESGTQILNDDIDRPRGSNRIGSGSSGFTELNNKLYFAADDNINGPELWLTDGTTNGTRLVKDINPGSEGFLDRNSAFAEFVNFDNKLYFAADDGVNGEELWVSDGTTNGTQLFKDINPGSDESYIRNITQFKNNLYFSANDGINGVELWVTDGTTDGTQLLKDINPGSYGYSPRSFTELNNKLYFAANDGVNGVELWVTDGTTDGTQLVKDIFPGTTERFGSIFPNDSNPDILTEFNNKLYFAARNEENGFEIWVSDGTTNGTQLLKDINPGSEDNNGNNYPDASNPSDFTELNNKLYFTADDGVNGREIWVSDGTTEGTQLLKDINPGSEDSFFESIFDNRPFDSVVFNNKLYFVADDGVNGRKLWVTDGTTEGTQLFANINPVRSITATSSFTVVGDELFFTSDNGTSGLELFKLTFDGSATITGTNRSDNLSGTANSDRIEGLGDNDTLNGLAGNDTLLGGNGNDNLVGGAGNDSLLGGNGSDSLAGGNGNDILDGGAGFDVLTNGAGNDIFVLQKNNGGDSIVDFKRGSDKLGLAGDLEFEDLTLSGNTIKSGNELLATLIGLNTANLTEANFVVV